MATIKDEKAETEQQLLIKSEDFDNALVEGSNVRDEIDGTFKNRNKDNYTFFFDIIVRSRRDIQEILDKKKKNRTKEDNDLYKKFVKETKTKYRLVKDMIFLSEDEKTDVNGEKNDVPKKVARLVETLSSVHAILRYIGNDILDRELLKNGVSVMTTSLENQSEVFENENVREDIKSVFTESCKIQTEIDSAKRKITEDIFSNLVPNELQYDKDTNPSGLRNGDFEKLVNLKNKLLKAERADEEAKEKANEQTISEAEKRTYEIVRNETIRAGLMAMGIDSGEEE